MNCARRRTIANYYPRRLIMSLPAPIADADCRTGSRNNDPEAKEKIFVNLFHRHYPRIPRISRVLFNALPTNGRTIAKYSRDDSYFSMRPSCSGNIKRSNAIIVAQIMLILVSAIIIRFKKT